MVVELIVKSATFEIVLPDEISVLPRVGAVYVVVFAVCTHEEPDHTYIALLVEFQYIAPTSNVLPSLSTVGAVALLPK